MKTLEIGSRYYLIELKEAGFDHPLGCYTIFTRSHGDVLDVLNVSVIDAGAVDLYEIESIYSSYGDIIRINDCTPYIGQEIHLYDITDGTDTAQIIQNKSVTWENIISTCNNVTIFFEILTPDLPYESMMIKITDIQIDLY